MSVGLATMGDTGPCASSANTRGEIADIRYTPILLTLGAAGARIFFRRKLWRSAEGK